MTLRDCPSPRRKSTWFWITLARVPAPSTWKLRFTDFEKFKPGDTLRYVGFHDNEWLAFSVCLAGKTYLGKGKNRKETWEIFPIGLATSFLRGDNPARVWIETSARRRPVMAKLETYFGNFRVDLLE